MALRIEKAFDVSMDILLRMQAWYDASLMRARASQVNVQRYEHSSLFAATQYTEPSPNHLMDTRVKRTDQAEKFLERLASVPLTWENVFRSPAYTVKSDKEVVDLLLVLRNRGIFVSMKCQQDPSLPDSPELDVADRLAVQGVDCEP